MLWASGASGGPAQLQNTLSQVQPSLPSATSGVGGLVVHVFDWAAGLFGLYILLVGAWGLLRLAYKVNKGESVEAKRHFFQDKEVPFLQGRPALQSLTEILLGFVLVGLVFSNGWIDLVAGMTHVANVVASAVGHFVQQVGNSAGG
ncbi:protein of unknown function [Candidatus Hydrogenisulfobacillus filiaventi]|uniref:Uncharacterized protein n=1 Tax=Candidatus Hydrogenisulfobacillus filiaventi TaxID=2707344 RepID=A0A6F8ZIH0_9FIRM|nr:protein of unknown function [Candidatus Hydrogenisulfobacillus filiaventi]